jgi:quinoprotein glucose dehydrogenase
LHYTSWGSYNGSKDNLHYSALTQIDTNNVTQLQVAWEYHTKDADTAAHTQIQCNPLMIDGVLYGVSAAMKLFALDATTGTEKWVFDANAKTDFDNDKSFKSIMINCRGIAYWSDGKNDKRIFFTAGSNTFAIDATTGKPIKTFGSNGSIDLHDGLGRDVSKLFIVNTSPGMIYKNLIILGTRVDEAPPAAPGHIRAYDVITGKQQWIFHTIPQPGEYGYETWENPEAYKHVGGANVWGGFTLDEAKGILFAPTGSAAYDFYGGKRRGSNLFANCLIALDAATGKRKWHYQILHHDLWDRDVPTPPTLVTIKKDGKEIEAVAQTTKTGMVYIFERTTGVPVYPIYEMPVDSTTDLIGEKVWPTQPMVKIPTPFVRHTFTEKDINPYLSPASKATVLDALKGYRYGDMYIPPGKKTSIVFPGYDGGGEWGGAAYDPNSGYLFVNANEVANVMQMVDNKIEAPKAKENYLQAGDRLYKQNCMACHGADRKGTGNNPSIVNSSSTYTNATFTSLLKAGRRMMPAFNQISDEERNAISAYVLNDKTEQKKPFTASISTIDSFDMMPYKIKGYDQFVSTDGYPAIGPPWGTLTAINLNTGAQAWQIPLGEYEELKAKGVPPTGTQNYGGPLVTKGGIVFIAASRDGKMRGFNRYTGKLLWDFTLPAAAFATPAIYELNKKEYLVIACGGGKLGTKSGDSYVAFALPDIKK